VRSARGRAGADHRGAGGRCERLSGATSRVRPARAWERQTPEGRHRAGRPVAIMPRPRAAGSRPAP